MKLTENPKITFEKLATQLKTFADYFWDKDSDLNVFFSEYQQNYKDYYFNTSVSPKSYYKNSLGVFDFKPKDTNPYTKKDIFTTSTCNEVLKDKFTIKHFKYVFNTLFIGFKDSESLPPKVSNKPLPKLTTDMLKTPLPKPTI